MSRLKTKAVIHQYEVCALPAGDVNYRRACVYVQRQQGDKWVVTLPGQTPTQHYSQLGGWGYAAECNDVPATYWNDLDLALELASEAAQEQALVTMLFYRSRGRAATGVDGEVLDPGEVLEFYGGLGITPDIDPY